MARISIRIVALVLVGMGVLIGFVVFLVPVHTRQVAITASSSSNLIKNHEHGEAENSLMVDNTDDRRAYLQSMNNFVKEHPQDVKAAGVVVTKAW